MIVIEKLEQMLQRFNAIEAEMAEGPDPEHYVKLASEHAELTPVVEKIREFQEAQNNLSGAEELLADAQTDAEMRELAELEREEAKEAIAACEEALKVLLLLRSAASKLSF